MLFGFAKGIDDIPHTIRNANKHAVTKNNRNDNIILPVSNRYAELNTYYELFSRNLPYRYLTRVKSTFTFFNIESWGHPDT